MGFVFACVCVWLWQGVTATAEGLPSRTQPIPWNATDVEVKQALEFLTGIVHAADT